LRAVFSSKTRVPDGARAAGDFFSKTFIFNLLTTMQRVVFVLFALFFVGQLAAQQPSMAELQRQLLEMQRRMFQDLQSSPFGGPDFALPQWDSTFQFRFDTTFEDGSAMQFFRFSPFDVQVDSLSRESFRDFDRFFEQFFDGAMPSQPWPENEENSAIEERNDGLLPEERLRQEGEKPKSDVPDKPAPKKYKAKTIRI
jgi:hypothetical protein